MKNYENITDLTYVVYLGMFGYYGSKLINGDLDFRGKSSEIIFGLINSVETELSQMISHEMNPTNRKDKLWA